MTCTCVAFRKSAKNPFLGLLTSYVKLVPDLSRGPGRKNRTCISLLTEIAQRLLLSLTDVKEPPSAVTQL